MKFASLFENLSWLSILAMSAALAFLIIPVFIKKDMKAAGLLGVKFMVCVLIVSGVTGWISTSRNLAGPVAGLLESTLKHAITMLKQGMTGS